MENNSAAPSIAPVLRRWLPLAALAGVMALAYGLGLHRYLSLQGFAEHRGQVQGFVADNLVLAAALYFVAYVVVVALSFPGAGVMSIAGGFIFGWIVSAPLTVVAATLGAIAVFTIVQTSMGATMARRAGPFVQRLAMGFENDAFNYLLFLRLVPAFPFFAVNAVAGLTRIKLSTFTLATFIGIMPGSLAFAFLGRGLGSVLDKAQAGHANCLAQKAGTACPYEFSLSSLVTPELIWGLAALGVISLLPIGLRKWRGA